MAFRVETSAGAESDVEAILEWLMANEAGEHGIRWFLGLEDAIASLADFPLRCPLAPESGRFPFEVRQLFYGRSSHVYRILFNVEEETVKVLHVRHGRRGPLR